jgi:hypothetical protein
LTRLLRQLIADDQLLLTGLNEGLLSLRAACCRAGSSGDLSLIMRLIHQINRTSGIPL